MEPSEIGVFVGITTETNGVVYELIGLRRT
jgi:hypothetical protein